LIFELRVGDGGRRVEKEVETSLSLPPVRLIHRDSFTFHREEEEQEAGHQEDPRENSMDADLNS
jgi:hypothetical protein